MTRCQYSEKQFPVIEIPNRVPPRNGKKLHPSTAIRWAVKGARGRKLRSWFVGGVRFTDEEALAEFLGPQNPSVKAARETQLNQIEVSLSRQGL